MTLAIPIDDQSRVAAARRAASKLAEDEGLDESLVSNVAVVTTEICTNLVKHGKGGEVFLTALSNRTSPGVEILSIDRGPGMADVSQCLADGYSSANTSGTGLGAIARLSTEFDIYSRQPQGTVLVARIQQKGGVRTSVGTVLKPIAGEQACGDAWGLRRTGDAMVLLVADGLGHGAMAALASAEAVSAFKRTEDLSPPSILQRVHAALRGTRGAAVATAYVDYESSTVRYAGIGNIAGTLLGGGKRLQMISQNGTAGFELPRLQEFSYPFGDETLIVMHSDGLQSLWKIDGYPGLLRRDPSLIAGVLYRDSARSRDDVCVVVSRMRGAG